MSNNKEISMQRIKNNALFEIVNINDIDNINNKTILLGIPCSGKTFTIKRYIKNTKAGQYY